MYIIRKWLVKRNIRICEGIEATLYHELDQNRRAMKVYMRQLEELQTQERHRVINEALETK